jgi:hypothetical protein
MRQWRRRWRLAGTRTDAATTAAGSTDFVDGHLQRHDR